MCGGLERAQTIGLNILQLINVTDILQTRSIEQFASVQQLNHTVEKFCTAWGCLNRGTMARLILTVPYQVKKKRGSLLGTHTSPFVLALKGGIG